MGSDSFCIFTTSHNVAIQRIPCYTNFQKVSDFYDKNPVCLPRHYLNQPGFALIIHDKLHSKMDLLPIYYFLSSDMITNQNSSSAQMPGKHLQRNCFLFVCHFVRENFGDSTSSTEEMRSGTMVAEQTKEVWLWKSNISAAAIITSPI